MKYQIYAYDKNGKLNHAGVHDLKTLTPAKLRTIERKWRKWRKEYIAEHPGDYPLAQPHKKTIVMVVYPIGSPEKTQQITI